MKFILPLTQSMLFLLVAASNNYSQTLTGFGFWDSVGDSVVVDGVRITLSGSNIETWCMDRVRDLPGPTNGQVVFTFDRPVREFIVRIERVASFESVDSFNIPPTSVGGDLVSAGSPITSVSTNGGGDHNVGPIIWSDINTTEISFRMANSDGAIVLSWFVLYPADVLGDINCDGIVDLLDVAPFVDLLSNGEYQVKADVNEDGLVNLLDVQPFVDLLGN